MYCCTCKYLYYCLPDWHILKKQHIITVYSYMCFLRHSNYTIFLNYSCTVCQLNLSLLQLTYTKCKKCVYNKCDVWKTNARMYFYVTISLLLEQKYRELTLPGDGCQAVEVPPCTSLLSNTGTRSHGSLWKSFFLPPQWYSSSVESLEDLMEWASEEKMGKEMEKQKERWVDQRKERGEKEMY